MKFGLYFSRQSLIELAESYSVQIFDESRDLSWKGGQVFWSGSEIPAFISLGGRPFLRIMSWGEAHTLPGFVSLEKLRKHPRLWEALRRRRCLIPGDFLFGGSRGRAWRQLSAANSRDGGFAPATGHRPSLFAGVWNYTQGKEGRRGLSLSLLSRGNLLNREQGVVLIEDPKLQAQWLDSRVPRSQILASLQRPKAQAASAKNEEKSLSTQVPSADTLCSSENRQLPLVV